MPFNITPDGKKYLKHDLYLNLTIQTSWNSSVDPILLFCQVKPRLGFVLITLFHRIKIMIITHI